MFAKIWRFIGSSWKNEEGHDIANDHYPLHPGIFDQKPTKPDP